MLLRRERVPPEDTHQNEIVMVINLGEVAAIVAMTMMMTIPNGKTFDLAGKVEELQSDVISVTKDSSIIPTLRVEVTVTIVMTYVIED